jgi:hypothetical protein
LMMDMVSSRMMPSLRSNSSGSSDSSPNPKR